MLLPLKNCLLNGLVSLVEFERVILIGSFLSLLGSTPAGQEIIYTVRWVGGRWFYNNPKMNITIMVTFVFDCNDLFRLFMKR